MEIVNEILKALSYLFVAYIVYFAWKIAFEETIKNGFKKTLLKGSLWCLGISLAMAMSLGQATCTDSEPDLRGNTCNEYADNGYSPTNEQRIASFAYFMTLLYIPVMLGIFMGRKED